MRLLFNQRDREITSLNLWRRKKQGGGGDRRLALHDGDVLAAVRRKVLHPRGQLVSLLLPEPLHQFLKLEPFLNAVLVKTAPS